MRRRLNRICFGNAAEYKQVSIKNERKTSSDHSRGMFLLGMFGFDQRVIYFDGDVFALLVDAFFEA